MSDDGAPGTANAGGNSDVSVRELTELRELLFGGERRQIDELRAQLERYAEALEEDLSAGREKVASRTREGLNFEKAFSEGSTLLLNHLKAKPEARALLMELMTNMHAPRPHLPR